MFEIITNWNMRFSTAWTILPFVWITVYCQPCPHMLPGLKRWSDPLTWFDGQKPGPNGEVEIAEWILLDESPPPLYSITITDTGKLVWSPEKYIMLTLNHILVKGEMHIGSEECPYGAKAHIKLTGIRGENVLDHPSFDEKFLGVDRNGTLELHGVKKLSWTKLTKTVDKISRLTGLIYDHKRSSRRRLSQGHAGIVMYVMNPNDGKVINFNTFTIGGPNRTRSSREVGRLVGVMDAIEDGHICLLAVNHNIAGFASLTSFYNSLERLAFGRVTGHSFIRRVGPYEAYVLAAQKGMPEGTTEMIDTLSPGNSYQYAATSLTSFEMDIKFSVESFISNRNPRRSNVNFRVTRAHASYPVLNLLDDVRSWLPGDRIVILSTDFDMNQAEEAFIVECPTCGAHQVRVDLEPRYTHFGKIVDGVDERGEVILLTRNIMIEGIMEASCPPSNENCNDYPYDTFGGHTKVVAGFKSVHIEGVEFYHMGQQTEIGHYPVHFHMCHDVDSTGGFSKPPYLRDSTIHRSFSRCVAIHGTHGLQVIDNVAYQHLGHCFFLEDGGEKRTVLDGNIGAITMKGSILPSDEEPATYLISNPLTTLRNNVAAGSAAYGIRISFPDEPIMLSEGSGFMAKGEAWRTPFKEFYNNVVHSNPKIGLLLDEKIFPNGTTGGPGEYDPHRDPNNPTSPRQEVVFYRLTAYKNTGYNAWIRGGEIRLEQASLADSARGLIFARGPGSFQCIRNSVIVGATSNLGEPSVHLGRRTIMIIPRSLPVPCDFKHSIHGFVFNDGPVYLSNVWFNGFGNKQCYKAGALGFQGNNEHGTSPVSSTYNLKFGYDDGYITGNRMYDENSLYDRGPTFFDIDGSVTGFPMTQAVKPDQFFVTPGCYFRNNWKMAVCPKKYGKLTIQTYDGSTDMPLVVRDDKPDVFYQGHYPHVIIGGTHSYTIHWPADVPQMFQITALGIERDFDVRVGVCIPRDATFELYSHSPYWKPRLVDWEMASSVHDLDNDTIGTMYFWDKETGLLFFKFLSFYRRTHDDHGNCPRNVCPMVRVTLLSGTPSDGDCRTRAYGTNTYRRLPDMYERRLPNHMKYVTIPKSSSHPPPTWGAGPTRPFDTRWPNVANSILPTFNVVGINNFLG